MPRWRSSDRTALQAMRMCDQMRGQSQVRSQCPMLSGTLSHTAHALVLVGNVVVCL